MPIHYSIERFELESEINRLKDANKKITFILPAMIEHKPGNVFGCVTHYIIIFEDKTDP